MLEERYALRSLRLRGKVFLSIPVKAEGLSSNEVLLKRSAPMANDE